MSSVGFEPIAVHASVMSAFLESEGASYSVLNTYRIEIHTVFSPPILEIH